MQQQLVAYSLRGLKFSWFNGLHNVPVIETGTRRHEIVSYHMSTLPLLFPFNPCSPPPQCVPFSFNYLSTVPLPYLSSTTLTLNSLCYHHLPLHSSPPPAPSPSSQHDSLSDKSVLQKSLKPLRRRVHKGIEADALLDELQPAGPVAAYRTECDGLPHHQQPLAGSSDGRVEQLQTQIQREKKGYFSHDWDDWVLAQVLQLQLLLMTQLTASRWL